MSDMQQQIIHAHEERITVLLAEIKRLRALEDAARALCDECKPDLSPSLGAVAKLADALNTGMAGRRALEES